MSFRIFATLALVALTPSLLFAQGRQAAERPATITATGKSVKSIEPDRAMVYVVVESSAGTAAEASVSNAGKLDRVIDAVIASGISQDSLETSAYDVGPAYSYADMRRELVDFRANALVRVPVNRLGDLGKIVDAVLAAGATEIRRIVFSSEVQDSARATALAEAVLEARTEALAAVAGLNVTLGELQSINIGKDWWEPDLQQITAEWAPRSVAMGAQVRVSASVTAIWRIEGSR